MLSLVEVEERLGAATTWKGRCFEIAQKVVAAGLVDGAAVYGHWLGPIASGSMFANRGGIGFVQHGWVLCPDGSVVDPTRWAFQDRAPYIYEGASDFYDEGGNRWRERNNPAAPEPDDTRPWVGLIFAWDDEDALLFVRFMYHGTSRALVIGADEHHLDVRHNQAFHLANLPFSVLGGYARPIFQALDNAGERALVPVDNWNRMERVART